jgi:tRNA wybutosine-synthesizing protein 3
LQAGFRESGALNLASSIAGQATPVVGIRSMGLAFESLVGFEVDGKGVAIIPDSHLKKLVEIANERFKENTKRIERFRTLLKEIGTETSKGVKKNGRDSEEWEGAQARRERKRAEGLKKAEAIKKADASQEIEQFGISILEEMY